MKGSIVCRLLLCLMILFRPGQLVAQVWDDFSDGDFTQGVGWTGDMGQYVVSGGMLRLNSTGSDSSFLVTALPAGSDTMEWSFVLKMPFSPSSVNYCRVYLAASQQHLEGPLDGYFLQFGETGSADAVTLYRQSGWLLYPLLRGRDSIVATSFTVNINVLRLPGGHWQLYTRLAGESTLFFEGNCTDAMISPAGYFGWKNVYTSGNATSFYLDDVYAGAYRRDTIVPQLLSAVFQNDSLIRITFSEAIDSVSAADPVNYSLHGSIHPYSAQKMSSGNQVELLFSQSLSANSSHTLCVVGVDDLTGNTVLTPQCVPVFRFGTASTGDIVITEIMADPTSSPGLPPVEYIEVFNRGTYSFLIQGWELNDATSSALLPDDTLHPGTYRVYADAALVHLFDSSVIAATKGVVDFPSLNNSGDHLELRDADGRRIDVIDYTLEMYRDPLRDDHGWSLERQDVGFACHHPLNWKASVDPSGGTPGRENSRTSVFADTTGPWPVHAYPLDSVHIVIVFSEYPDTSGDFVQFFEMNLPGQSFDSLVWDPLQPLLTVTLTLPLDSSVIYQLTFLDSITDCAGNRLSRWATVDLALPVAIFPGDVRINEILFNPFPDGSDFVEVYHSGNSAIDLSTLRIAHADPETGIVSDPTPFSPTPRLLLPGQYAVVADHPSDVQYRYKATDTRNFISTPLPSFNDDEGIVVLLNQSLLELERYHYREDHHFPLLTDPEGVSLERISFYLPATDSTNWHSAAERAGFATPGARNSQALNPAKEKEKLLWVDPVLFTPDNNGEKDVQLIVCRPPQQGYVAHAALLDQHGEVVRTLARQELLGEEGRWIWDGLDDAGLPTVPGIYIAVVELFHINGQTKSSKTVSVVARPLENGN